MFEFLNFLTIFILFSAIQMSMCQKGGGMAELKSITGDAPYSGVGNAPAPIPQPMGFWGRPRYSPGAGSLDVPYGSLMGPGGGGGPFFNPYTPYNRFTSASGSPYGLGSWYSNF